MDEVTLIIPYYRQPKMLQYQLAELNQYPPAVQVIIVDDGSPEPALPVIQAYATPELLTHLRLFKITVDIPWNREECRNLGAHEATTDWMIQLDIDHVLPVVCIPALLAFQPHPARWYRFPRSRLGQADETRRKDRLPEGCTFGQIHPHVDSYLVRTALYWEAGGYDEATFSGVLGGGGEFLERLAKVGQCFLLPEEIRLQVVTRHVVADASDTHCSRDTAPGKERWRALRARGQTKPTEWLLWPWERVL